MIYANWMIYESDIKFAGGSVLYEKGYYRRGLTSYLRNATIVLEDVSQQVVMQCFYDGTAAIMKMQHRNQKLQEAPGEYPPIIQKYHSIIVKNRKYHQFTFVRRIKQILVGLSQIICLFSAAAAGMKHCFPVFAICLALLFLLGAFYSRIRRFPFEKYRNILFLDTPDQE